MTVGPTCVQEYEQISALQKVSLCLKKHSDALVLNAETDLVGMGRGAGFLR